jgi:hypothetical protein
VHRIALHPSRPDVLFMQKHWDIMRSDNSGDQWTEVSGNLPTDFGFPIDVHFTNRRRFSSCRSRAIRCTTRRMGSCACIAARRAATNGRRSRSGLPQKNCYVNVLRDAMAVDSLDDCGIYFGTTGGQVYCSPDGGNNWKRHRAHICRRVLSVEVQTLK